MKKFFLVTIFNSLSMLIGGMMHANQISSKDLSYCLVANSGTLQPELLQLLKLLNIDHDGSLDDVVAKTQKAWLRKPDSERWHMHDVHADKSAQLLKIFNTLGMLNAVYPSKQHYTYAVVLGSTANSMRDRLAFLLQCWNSGVRFDHIVFLVSERPLDPQQETLETIINPTTHPSLPYKSNWQEFSSGTPKTEHDIMRLIYAQTDLPADFAALPTTFINTPMQPKPDGGMRRANTADTIHAWLATNPLPGSCCFISDQPYVGYQDAVVRTFLPAHFNAQTVGQEESGPIRNAVMLDTLARWLYQEKQRRQIGHQ